MKHFGTRTLETERLILRKFSLNDAEHMYKNWANDNDVTKFLTWKTHENVNVSKSVLEEWTSKYYNEDFYNWAIVLKSINEPVGSIGVVKQNDEIKMVHIGYCTGKKWWNKGITSEALAVLIKYFFEEIGINRIESRHDPNNPNSGKVMKKCGLKYEGTMRQADKNNQGICDYSEYGILAEEYFNKNY
ncbi:GNAT family acetyltransferase [Spirochaetia bacterium]|nr:GNAT family acetyltransferase [Spirochaetia bacterium]